MISYRLFGLFLASTLAACSGKPDAPAAPAAPAAQPVVATASAPAAALSPPAAPELPAATADTITVQRKASLECEDRTIVVEATCSGAQDDAMLMCSKQSLTVADRATGDAKTVRAFAPAPDADKGAPPGIDEKIGALTCIRAQTDERYILADMYNGGNCDECEWRELYDWDGKLVASDRERRKQHAVLNELIRAQVDKSDRVFGQRDLVGLYAGRPH